MTDKIPPKNILFTGPPGCGKSTLIEKIVRRMDRPCTGFFTKELRDKGHRVGFAITTLDGRQGILAHVNHRAHTRVGKYGVNLEDLDRIAVPSILPENEDDIVVIDEIGKMECLSDLFKETLLKVLDTENTVIGSIARRGDAFMGAVKNRPDTRIIETTEKKSRFTGR